MQRHLPWLLMLLGLLLGTACSSGGEGTTSGGPPPPPTHDHAELGSATKVLDADTRAALTSYSSADGTLVFARSTPLLDGLAPGAILVSQTIPPAAPLGFLRKVTSVDKMGTGVIVHSTQAKLTEALKSADVNWRKPVGPEDVATFTGEKGVELGKPQHSANHKGHIPPGHGLPITLNNFSVSKDGDYGSVSLTLNGTIVIDTTLNFRLNVAFDATKGGVFVQDFLAYAELDVDSDLTVGLDVSLQANKDIEENLFSTTLTPVDVQVGPYPLVFVPTLTVKVHFGAKGTVSFSVHESESVQLAAGGEFQHDRPQQWENLSFANGTGELDHPSVQASVVLDCGPSIKFGIKLYDASPGVYVQAWAAATLDATTPRHPFFRAGLHAELDAGADVGIGDWLEIASWTFPVVAWDFPVWQSPNITPLLAVTQPAEGLHVPLGHQVRFEAAVWDLEDGADDESHVHLTWTSDVDGVIGHGAQFWQGLDGQKPGMRTITITATDSDGGMSTVVRHLYADPRLPDAVFINPRQSDVVFANTMIQLQASGTSASLPLQDLCSTPGFSFTWTSDVASDQIADPHACGTTAGLFTDTSVPHTLTYEIDDPWGGKAYASVVFSVAVPPPNTFSSVFLTPATPGVIFSMAGVFTNPIVVSVATTPAMVDPTTYTWKATSFDTNNNPHMKDVALGTTTAPQLSWSHPENIPGFLDMAAWQKGEQIEIDCDVADANGMTGSGHVTITVADIPP